MIARSLAIAALMVGVAASQAFACSCSNGGARTALRISAAVYVARVVAVSGVRATPYDAQYRRTRLLVTQAIKGVRVGDTVVVDTEVGSSCAAELQLGEEWLVYASPDRDGSSTPVTRYCDGTTPIACAADDLRTLGVPVPRRARSCAPPPPPRRSRSRPAA